MSLSLEQLLDKYVPVKNPEGCWLWTGSKTKKGYASCRYEDHTGIVHRLVYESFTGPIPVEMEIDHLCRMRHCVNPAHLEAVTHIENLRRGESYWRNRTHCSHGHAYTAENTYITSSGTRACRACRFERSHRADNWKGNVRPGERTHCPQGHPYDKENTYFAPRGGRRCKECNRVRARYRIQMLKGENQ